MDTAVGTGDPSLADLAALGAWMDQQGLPAGRIENVSPVGGGTQNVMLRFGRGEREYVLRRGPRHLRQTSNDAIRREATVLAALRGTNVPVPELVASCPDEAVLGAAFFLMRPVDGFNASTELPEFHRTHPQVRHEMGLAAARALAQLGGVDHVAVGLDGLGNPDGFLERQVPRWLSELESFRAYEGYGGPDLPHVDAVAGWLTAERPAAFRPGIMHGDFHLANLMFSRRTPKVAAIVDWEMCTVGDPLMDLGWLLATWPEPGSLAAEQSALGRAGGLPDRNEVIQAYSAHSARDLSALTWYAVVACFKLGILLEGSHARACAGQAPAATGKLLHKVARELFDRAHGFIREGL